MVSARLVVLALAIVFGVVHLLQPIDDVLHEGGDAVPFETVYHDALPFTLNRLHVEEIDEFHFELVVLELLGDLVEDAAHLEHLESFLEVTFEDGGVEAAVPLEHVFLDH